MRQFIVTSFIALGLVVAGCSGDEQDNGSSKQAASAGDYCDTVCSVVSSCDKDQDKDTCQKQCERNQGTTFSNYRSDLIKNVEACVASSDCEDVFTSDESIGNACFRKESAKIAPAEAAESFCEAAQAKYRECTSGEFDVAGCLELVKPNNDGVLAEAEACLSKSCQAYNDCLSATIDVTIASN